MPIYEYRCKSCGRTHEVEQGFHDERPTQCPSCGGALVRIFHPIGLVFKGSGFHKTDYGAPADRSSAPKPAAPADGKAGEAKSPKEKPSESKPADAKADSKPSGPSSSP